MGTHWELEGNILGTKENRGGWFLFILAGLLFKFLVAWFVPNGKGFEQNILKLWAGFGRGNFLRANYGFVR
jgi:hypothetical protein